MKYFLLAVEEERESDVFESLKPCQIGTSPLGPSIWFLEC